MEKRKELNWDIIIPLTLLFLVIGCFVGWELCRKSMLEAMNTGELYSIKYTYCTNEKELQDYNKQNEAYNKWKEHIENTQIYKEIKIT